MKMTQAQERAVNHRGSTLLVSAGAGSGKTSTLSKRIIDRISDVNDTAELDDFLIVTFTNASAADLCEKIEKAMINCVEQNIKNKKALRQLSKLKYSNISTISSFCLGVIKKHFQQLGLPAKVRVCDESEALILKNQAINRVIENKYASAEEGSPFFAVVELFSSGKNDENLFDVISRLHTKAVSQIDTDKYLDKIIALYDEVIDSSDYLSTFYGWESLKIVKDTIGETVEGMNRCFQMIKDIKEFENYVYLINEEIEELNKINDASSSLSYEEFRSLAMSFEKRRLPIVRYGDELKTRAQDLRNESLKLYLKTVNELFSADNETVRNAARDSKLVLAELISIIKAVDEIYIKEKTDRGLVDFSDAERLTYKLFVKSHDDQAHTFEPSDIAKQYRDSFVEIYIDEYQDINPIQDMIFKSISRYDENGHELNRFMVGDIKQSIYRFRGARPDLFASYLNEFSPINETEIGVEAKEYLSENFRCSRSVVDFTNLVFDCIMSDSYNQGDRLVFSRNEECEYIDPCEVILFDKQGDADDYYENEIKITAQKIIEIVNDKSKLSSTGKPFEYSDIAVLMPSPKKVADKYARYFENLGIPTFSEITENFFENAEILLCLCLLNTIDNPQRDIYLVGAMRSEIFMFSDDDLVAIRQFYNQVAGTEQSMWESVKAIACFDGADEGLRDKCKDFVETIEYFKKYSYGNSSDKLILKLYSKLHLVNVVSERSFNRYSGAADLRRENLYTLYNLARNFEKTSFRGLSAFLEHLNNKMQKPESVRSATTSESAKGVRIMSIHHSKGLEFPVCILCGISKKFNNNDSTQRIIIDDEGRAGLKLRDLDVFLSCNSGTGIASYNTPFRKIVQFNESKQLINEQKRLLYVAMTRAKDKLVIMLENKDDDDIQKYFSVGTSKSNDYKPKGLYEWIYMTVCSSTDGLSILNDAQCTQNSELKESGGCFRLEYLTSKKTKIIDTSKNDAKATESDVSELKKEISKRIDFIYPYKEVAAVQAKITVSEIKHNFMSKDEELEPNKDRLVAPSFIEQRLNPAEKGTAMHTFMQFASFENCEINVFDEAKRLLENGYLTGEQYRMLDYEQLKSFFYCDLYQKIKQAKKVYRELAFTLSTPINTVYQADIPNGDEKILVQGKIDCLLENSDGSFSVIDFKSDRIALPEKLKERYSVQMEYYKRAVREITESDNVKGYFYSFALSEHVDF